MKTLLVATLLILSGCAVNTSVLMVDPKAGDERGPYKICAGYFKVSLIASHWKRAGICVKRYRGLGYKKSEDLTPEERSRLNPELRNRESQVEIINKRSCFFPFCLRALF